MRFDNFHFKTGKHQLKSGQVCLLIEHDGSVTAGYWIEGFASSDPKDPEGFFVKLDDGNADPRELFAWQFLNEEDALQAPPAKKGKPKTDIRLDFEDFHVLKEDDEPADGTACLLVLKDGHVDAGIWDQFDEQLLMTGERGLFYRGTLVISYADVEKWTPLTGFRVDCDHTLKYRAEHAAAADGPEAEQKPEDPDKFKYGYSIEPYYDRAFKKLKKEYPWAERKHMHPDGHYIAVKKVGSRYEFMDYGLSCDGRRTRHARAFIRTGDDLVSHIYYSSLQTVQNANYERKFPYGLDADVYVDKAFAIVKEEYPWARRDTVDRAFHYTIEKIGEYHQYVQHRKDEDGSEYSSVREHCNTGDDFIASVVADFTECLMKGNEVVESYAVPHGSARAGFGGCWNLERYEVSRLESGDFKVYVQAGDRTGGAGRDFYVSAEICKAESYDAFLDAYQEIVPGGAFGLYKEDLIGDEKLKKFFGF